MRLPLVRIVVRAIVLAAALHAGVGVATVHAQEADCDQSRREVRTVRFNGNQAYSAEELSARVPTTPSSLWHRWFGWFFNVGTRRCFPDVGLGPDSAALKQFYENNGFYDTRIEPMIKPAGVNAVDVTFRINEGEPIRLDTLSILGLDSVAHRDDLLKNLQLRVGGRFGRVPMYTDIDSITARLRNAGYPRVMILPSYSLNKPEHRASVELLVNTGPRARFGEIAIASEREDNGKGEIDSATVLRLLGFRTGDTYSDRALVEAQRNLYNLGAYRHVGIAVDTTWQHGPQTADVALDLREDYLRQVDLEGGWGTLDCFRVNALYTDKNAFNTARRVELTGRLSKIGFGAPTNWSAARNLCYRPYLEADSLASSQLNYYAGATVRAPTLFGTHWVPAYSAYTERRGEYKAYLRTTYLGGEASATRSLGLGIPFRAGYTMEYGQTAAQPAVLCAVFLRCNQADMADVQRKLRFAVASASIQRVRTDNAVVPTSGYIIGAETRGGAPFILSDPSLSFFKTTADGSVYHQLRSRMVFAARLRGGFIVGGSDAGGAKLPPPQERLYAGGATSVRGFQQNELGSLVYLIDPSSLDTVSLPGGDFAYVTKPGTRAQRTIPVGGNSLFVFNAELRMRDPFFPELIEYVPFVDGGEVWTRADGQQNLGLTKLRVTPGLGLRVFSPIGPIQVNAGYNPYPAQLGKGYYAVPVDLTTNRAPLICVTGPGAALVPIHRLANGQLDQNLAACPASFAPFQSSNFFKRFALTLSIGTDF